MTAQSQDFNYFYEHFENWKEQALADRFFKHADIQPLISELKNTPGFSVEVEGKSVEGRDIHLIKWGEGSTTVFMWSQMHGDEPTATMALFDMFNFLRDPANEAFTSKLANEVTLLFVPMVNPDGAEVYKRRNALDIDLNRDALRLQNPESQLLKRVRDRHEAEFGFNLHDQSVYYATSDTRDPVAIAFLAPAFNEAKEVNEVRKRAIELIGVLHEELREVIPGKIARYDDTFEPRAFGDNMQLWGTSTILVESGGYLDDPEKQYLRKLHFALLMSALTHIASGSYAGAGPDSYEAIPMNRFNHAFSLVVRNATLLHNSQSFKVDLGFRKLEVLEDGRLDRYRTRLNDIGDLSTFSGYHEFDAKGLTIWPAKACDTIYASIEELLASDWQKEVRNGCGYFRVSDAGGRDAHDVDELPFRIIGPDSLLPTFPSLGEQVVLMAGQEYNPQVIIVNGQAVSLSDI